MGQVVGSESVLLFDDVSQDEPEGVSLHQLIKTGPYPEEECRGERRAFSVGFSLRT